jgi:uncharacterized protein (DUF1697 family)
VNNIIDLTFNSRGYRQISLIVDKANQAVNMYRKSGFEIMKEYEQDYIMVFERKLFMDKIKYIALLRGINAGGRNIIKMDELKRIFEEIGFSDVTTYIQSGNVVFSDIERDKLKVIEKTKKKIAEKIKTEINIVILTLSEIKEIINTKPENFGENNEEYKYDVIFLIEPLTVEDAIKEFNPRDGVDKIFEGKRVLYFSRLKKEITKSRFSRIIESKIYQKLTIRNWNTTKKMYELISEE